MFELSLKIEDTLEITPASPLNLIKTKFTNFLVSKPTHLS